jgi:hypothetical protein
MLRVGKVLAGFLLNFVLESIVTFISVTVNGVWIGDLIYWRL